MSKKPNDNLLIKDVSSENARKKPNKMIIAIVVLSMGLAVLAMSTLSFYSTSVHYRTQLENVYQRAFFELTSNVNDLEIKLSKLMISNSNTQVQKNLNALSKQTDNTQSNLSQLPASHNTINKTMRFVNQLGDYSAYLSNKVAAGGSLSEENYEVISGLYGVNKNISNELRAMMTEITEEIKRMYRTGNNNNNIDPLSNGFDNIQETSVDYPKMIYDGPFSDSVLDAEIKMDGEEVTKEQAEEKLQEYLSGFDISEVKFTNEVEGKIAAYNFDVKYNSGNTAFVQISKIGGRAILIDNNRPLDNYTLEVDQCVEKAEEFAVSLGYDNMTSVWASDYNGQVYVNLAPEVDGVIYYPDLVKVIVARDNGEILGLETMTYFANHKERSLEDAALTVQQARAKVSSKIEIVSEKLVLIPIAGNKETLAYEFAGEWNDLKYFIFIDASTGDELDVFRVIDSEQGTFMV